MSLMHVNLAEPHQKYFLESGEEVPGVTTVCGGTMPDGMGLRWWFWDQGRQGTPWPIPPDKTEASLGTIIHARVEAWLRGYDGIEGPEETMALLPKSEAPFARFCARWEASGYEKIGTEMQMVSESLRVGGTLDILCRCPKRGVGIVDIKSSKPYKDGIPYEKVLVQCGGYSRLAGYDTNHATDAPRWVEVWRVGKSEKDQGDVYEVKNLHACERAFESAVEHFYRLRQIA